MPSGQLEKSPADRRKSCGCAGRSLGQCAAPNRWVDIGKGLRERPPVTCRVPHDILPFAVRIIFRALQDRRAMVKSPSVVIVEVLDADHDRDP